MCKLAETAWRLGRTSLIARSTPETRALDKAESVLAEVAFDNHHHAKAINKLAATTLSSPQRHVGEPVAFYGYTQEVVFDQQASHFFVRPYMSSHLVCVVTRGNVGVVKGEYCLVIGVVAGHNPQVPIVMAVATTGLCDIPAADR